MSSTESIRRLTYQEKVSVTTLRNVLKDCLAEVVVDKTYDGEKAGDTIKKLSDTIKERLKSLGHGRYKFVVQAVIGEARDQGVRSGTRCFWDANTDTHATETLVNDNLFACATAYAIYLY